MSGRVPVCQSIVPLPARGRDHATDCAAAHSADRCLPSRGDIPRSGTRPVRRRSSPSGATFESSGRSAGVGPNDPGRGRRGAEITRWAARRRSGSDISGCLSARRVGEQRGGNRGTHGSILDGGVTFGDCLHTNASASVISGASRWQNRQQAGNNCKRLQNRNCATSR